MSGMCTMPRMNIFVMGLPGSGKGTQSKKMAEHYGLPHITSGDLLRTEAEKETPMGKEISALFKTGKLFPDELVEKVLLECVPESNFILDGYPRKLSQTDTFKNVDLVVFIDLPEEEALKRISHRDEGRPDDNKEVAKVRLKEYRAQTKPVIDYYEEKGKLVMIDGEGSVDDVFGRIKEEVYKKLQV